MEVRVEAERAVKGRERLDRAAGDGEGVSGVEGSLRRKSGRFGGGERARRVLRGGGGGLDLVKWLDARSWERERRRATASPNEGRWSWMSLRQGGKGRRGRKTFDSR